MISSRNEKSIPNPILTALYSHIAPKEFVVSVFPNLLSFSDNASTLMSSIAAQDCLHDSLSSFHKIRMSSIDEPSEYSEIFKIKELNQAELMQFLIDFNVRNCHVVKYALCQSQFSIILRLEDNLGLQLLFASVTKNLALIAYFLTQNHRSQSSQARSSKNFALKAIECIKHFDNNLPSLFIPNFDVPPFFSIPVGCDPPSSPTAITSSSTMAYIGGKNGIHVIPLHRFSKTDPIELTLPTSGEPYSLVYLNGLLIYSSPSSPAICIADPLEDTSFPLNISYRGHFFAYSNTFSHPIVTDGQYLYSIDYGTSPRIKVFKFELEGIVFDRVITLQSGRWALKTQCKDLLPLKLKDVASVATNGVFISFIFDFNQNGNSICRTFSVRDGVHMHDKILHNPAEIKAWTFDINRPSHCLILDQVLLLIDSDFTLPTWFVGFEMPLFETKALSNTTESIAENYSSELAVNASHFIGSDVSPSLNFEEIPGIMPLEECLCYFIDSRNKYASQAFLAYLPFIIMSGEHESDRLLKILEKMVNSFVIEEYSYLQHQIAFAFLYSFDTFAQVDLEKTSSLLLLIINNKNYSNLLFRFLTKAYFLTKALSLQSLEGLCELALNTTFIHQTSAISLLRRVQYDLTTCRDPLFLRYVKIILKNFENDLNHFFNDEWSEQRLTSCASFNVFKEMILVIESTHHDYEFSLDLLIDFFSLGCIPNSENVPIISRLIERSLFVSFEIFLFMIEKDTNFYKFDGRSKLFTGKGKSFVYDKFGLDDDIISAFLDVLNDSYIVNLDDSYITNEINSVFDKVRTGKLSKSQFLEKCNQVSTILPQLFSNVALFFKSDKEFATVDSYESACVRFVSLFSSPIYHDSPVIRIVFAYFIPRMFHVRQHFLMVPKQILGVFVSQFELWHMLMPEILVQTNLTSKMIYSLSTDALLYSEQTLFEVSNIIESFTPKIDEKDMLRSLILANIAISKGIELDINYYDITKSCLISGDYQIIRQVMMMLLHQIQNLDLSIIDLCLEFVGSYLSGEKIMFYYQSDKVISYQNCFLIADYLRPILKKVPLIFRRLESFGEPSYAQKLGIFAVMSNTFDVLRLRGKISAISDVGQIFSGEIEYFDEKSVAIETEDRSIAYIQIDGYDCSFSGLYSFDPKIVGDLSFTKNLLFKFEPRTIFHDIFKFAAMNEFMKLEEFRALCSVNEISAIAARISNSFVPLNKSVNDFSQLMIFHMTPLQVFSFNQASNECVLNPLKATVETIHSSFFTKNPNKKKLDKVNFCISDVITSFDESLLYVSSPIHPKVAARIVFNIISNNEIEPHLILTIYMIGKSPGSFFMSHPIICDSSTEPTIEIRPHLHSILIRTLSLHDVNVFIQPTCDFIFITARIASSTIISYSFQYDLGVTTVSKTAEISIPRYCPNEDPPLPFQMSSIFVDSQMKEDTNHIVSYYAMNMIIHFPNFQQTHSYIPYSLLHIDQLPFDTNVDFKNFKKCIYTEFAEKSLLSIKNDPKQLSNFVGALLNDVKKNVKRYLKSAFGSRNMSATIFTDEIDSPLNNAYLISKGNISYYHSFPNSNLKCEGITYLVPFNDITDSVVELFVKIRHVASIILFLSNSNNFLVENITKLIHLINDQTSSYLVSTKLVEVLNRLIPKHLGLKPMQRAASTYVQSRPEIDNRKKKSSSSLYIGIASLNDSELRSALNFSENPIVGGNNGMQKVSISEFDKGSNLDQQNSIIARPASQPNFETHEMTVVQLKDWVCGEFCEFFGQNNIDNLDARIEMFFSMNNSLKCFPLTKFLEQLFFCSSNERSVSFTDKNSTIPFDIRPTSKLEFLYFYIDTDDDDDDENEIKFEVSFIEVVGNRDICFEIEPNKPYILPPCSINVKCSVTETDSPKSAIIRYKTFIFTESAFYKQIEDEVFKWRPCFSHQLLLSFPGNEIMTPISYSFLPLSSFISFETASFFLHILRKNPMFVSHHTLSQTLPDVKIPKMNKTVISIVPSLTFIDLDNYKPKNLEETSVIIALLSSYPQELNYTISFDCWKAVCDTGSPPNKIFNYLTTNQEKFDPMRLRMICTNNSFVDFDVVYNNIIWKDIDDERKAWIEQYLRNLKPFILSVLVECITGHWGTKSLLKSENPYILIMNISKEDTVKFHQTIQTIEVGYFSDKSLLISSFKSEIHQYIISNYV